MRTKTGIMATPLSFETKNQTQHRGQAESRKGRGHIIFKHLPSVSNRIH